MKRRPFPLAPALLALLAIPAPAFADDNLFSSALVRYGWWAALPAALLAGLGTAATPCVYPMIAITVSVFGARREKGARAMLLSTAFVAGLAAMFVPLGLVAGLSGALAGSLAGRPSVQLFEAALMLTMAASMFGLFEISLPPALQNRLASVGGLGVRGAFVIGFVMGPIAAPCATAGLVGILDYVFRQQDAAGGAAALLAYSIGLGLPFWLVGTFALGLPKPGLWMDRVKSVFGLVLVVMGFYYLRHLVPFFHAPPHGLPRTPWLGAAIAAVGLVLGAVHLSLKEGTPLERARKVLSIALVGIGSVWWVNYEPPAVAIAWSSNARAAADQARSQHRPVLIDFGANWCAKCEELAHRTFNQPSVQREASRFIPIRVDASEPSDEVESIQRSYSVRGLPTVLVFDSSGREALRLTDFVPPERMVELLQRVN